ncbi:Methyl-accepting chemotaxis protein II [Tepidimonas alkaliphilus]|uniref:Methyl-accepting chemotaxis protein II n=1 Tax=Tepidimonas alkaliphilus TaxID=2588942 RepID=A0A554WBC7_9BURK|nr:methyl-accepting chemotaxis protein [Tepidimonas alkaliphilus]TSE20880.1 Methyl-accepting chemotaxis protein II [Tepidimonas alkaliphilus]
MAQVRWSFEWRVLFRLGAVIAAVVVALLGVRLWSQQATMLADRKASLQLQTQQYAREAQRLFESAAATAAAMASALDELRRSGHADRKVANDIVRGGLISNPLIIGASTAWEPNAFDGKDAEFVNADALHDETGRLIPWWFRSGSKIGSEKLIDYEKPGAGDWYVVPRQKKRQVISEPYPYPVEGKDVLMVTISQPILEGERFLGLTTVDVPLDTLSDRVARQRLYDSGHMMLVSDQAAIVAHPQAERNGQTLQQAGYPQEVVEAVRQGRDGVWEVGGQLYAVESLEVAQTGQSWAVVSVVPKAEVVAPLRRDAWLGAGLGLVALLLVLGAMGWELKRSVLGPLGDDPHEVARHVTRVAEGDLSGADWRGHELAPGSVVRAVRDMEERLAQTIRQIRQGSEQVTAAAQEIAQGNRDLSARTESAAASLQQTAASVQHLTEGVRHSAQAARTASELAQQAAAAAQQGGQRVGQVVATMGSIEQASQKMADIIGVIDGIAFQTNILALNAAVEAARAGEAGRGFAVVAAEVRALAQRSAQAAKEIKELIEQSVARVKAGGQEVQQAGQTMGEIVRAIERVVGVIGEVTAAASEQSQSLSEVNTAVGQLDQATQQNAALVEQMTAAAESLRQQAQDLLQAVARFRLAESARG